MKSVLKIFSLFTVINLFTWIAPPKASAQVSLSFQLFYDDLSPYGNWVDNSDYGYVWLPNVEDRFTPYSTNGYWAYTNEGWMWVSNYSWGWAPFHYGRWFYDNNYGWAWAPDNEWGPGWVTWRSSNDYYGWAPIGPGISIDIAYGNGYNLPYNQWTFVRNGDFGRTNINNYYINNSNNVTIINNTTVINNMRTDNGRNVRYNAGPDRREAERRSGKTFAEVNLRESNKAGQGLRNGEVYRPRVEKSSVFANRPAPSKVANMEEVKNRRQRNNDVQPQKETQPIRVEPTKPMQPRNDQPTKQPAAPKRNEQPVKQPVQQRNDQPTKQPAAPKRNEQPVKQPVQKPNDQPTKQPVQKPNEQPVKQPVQKPNDQPTKQPVQKPNEQPVKQPVQKPNNQPTKQRKD